MKANHRLNPFRVAKPCGINGCNRKHHQLLHSFSNKNINTSHSTVSNVENASTSREIAANDSDDNTREDTIEQSPSQSVSGVNMSVMPNDPVLFMMLPVVLYANARRLETFAFLDTGSSFTLIDDSVLVDLDLKGTPEPLTMNLAKRGASELQQKYPHLRNLPLISFENATPKILIGTDNAHLLTYDQKIQSSPNDPVAIKIKMGWCVFGNSSQANASIGRVYMLHERDHQDVDLHDLFRSYSTTESFGCKPLVNELKSVEEKRVNEIVKNTLVRKENQYEVGLLWKRDEVELPDNYDMALKRLTLIESRTKKNPELADWYSQQVNDFENKSYCRKLENPVNKNNKTWYIPIFHVTNTNKQPVKIRLVFDAAAKHQGKSLNSELMTGPNIYTPLPGVLFRSREGKISVAADIKEMFLQVKIRQEDQDAQMFLWRDCDQSREPDVYVMTSMMFGSACSPYLAQIVKNTNAARFKDEFPTAVEAITKQHYVDNYLNSHDETPQNSHVDF